MHHFVCLLMASVLAVSTAQRPPKINILPRGKTILFIPGTETRLPCVADGSPTPTYTWQVNSRTFNITATDDRVVQVPDEGTIVFKNPMTTDEGIYQCFASNEYGMSASVKIVFRKAMMDKFRLADRKTFTVQADDPLTLNCDPPDSFPRPDIAWGIKQRDGRWLPVEFTKRVWMDPEGVLRFSNVKKADEQSGKTYVCAVFNLFLRRANYGPEIIIKVSEGPELYRPASITWTSPTEIFFLKGDNLKLGCSFSGSPAPDVSWKKLNGDKTLPANRTELKQQELLIYDLELSDAGQYQCIGVNSESMDGPAQSFNVRIESRPYWVDEPKDVTANEGGHATFVCRADGVPKPLIRWYINGEPINSSKDPRIKSERFNASNSNTITMTDLNVKDSMNIQCNASNRHDYIWADVYLDISGAVSVAGFRYGTLIGTFFVGICIMAFN